MGWSWMLSRTLKTQWRTTQAARPRLATLPARCSIKCKEMEEGLLGARPWRKGGVRPTANPFEHIGGARAQLARGGAA